MSLAQALEQDRKEILQLLDGQKSSKASHSHAERRTSPAPASRSKQQDSSSGPARQRAGPIAALSKIPLAAARRASMSSPLASSSPWTNTLLSEWDDSIYDTDADEPEQERRSSDSVSELAHARRKKELEDRDIDIDAGYLFGMQGSVPHFASARHSTKGGKGLTFVHFCIVRDSRRPSNAADAHQSVKPTHPSRYLTTARKFIGMGHDNKESPDVAPGSDGGVSTAISFDRSTTGDDDRNVRLAKDTVDGADDNSDSADSSGDADTSSDDEAFDIRKGPAKPRGRSKEKVEPSPGTSPAPSPMPPGGWSGKRGPGPLPPGSPRVGGALSLFNELEEERELNGPLVTHRGANGRRTVLSPGPRRTTLSPGARRSGVHPHTSFDHNGSGMSTPVGSDDEEDLSDLKQAQNLSIHLSSVDTSIPDRAIRTIIRGDFPRLQQEAEKGSRRQRKYLVATDLSEESVYALEWTIGTILRDGDTLFAVNAVADENASGVDLNTCVQIGDGATVIKHTTDVVGKQTEKTALKYQASSSLLPNALAAYFGNDSKATSRNNSVDSRTLSRAEQDRSRAIEDISDTCVRLLRKTMLQVRVAVEVIHCRSPKHLLTEAIDGLDPTLVILGSRGRSALKGVLLGSFSNYLVTKSSVPVMVARKKLRKQSKKTRIRLSNNLTISKGLAGAKID
ncbi:hypothetical protein BGW36DRAFT_396776 [Talaromyces proteolyticus]|uniref:UspA domain-containing protein n=1 Tax=Talaromyces proteolyticus TaxID=1131652 RepID=A0AAD4Q241_9EURO|nr:uncharacterized protein BGW36DRAFT_396776 [Talaromyces proteolyticus]KAH8699223.1 hypothetical protein BGW36DRAFT_396776 [Talaromyces proteolyticus]